MRATHACISQGALDLVLSAPGVTVSAMMFITTILASLAFLMAYDANVFLVVAFFLFFGFIDCVYLSANLEKVGTAPPRPPSPLPWR